MVAVEVEVEKWEIGNWKLIEIFMIHHAQAQAPVQSCMMTTTII